MSDAPDPNSPSSCRKCGSSCISDETYGLCPACLLAGVMTPPEPKGSWEAPGAEELAAMLPQYEIEGLLGRGGMGAVYQGRQADLDRRVAIKILPANLGNDGQDYAARFKLEARAMARLKHPGIVTVYDFGQTAEGLLYFVMEFVEGMDVQAMISREGRIHSANAIAIAAHVCEALHYAHSHGIIHRDIKPANVIVGYDGHVRVADFGLAKVMNADANSPLTLSGTVMGTPNYFAPEALVFGTEIDHRADVYAVGVMLYHMLTGKVPYGAFEMPSFQIPGMDPRLDTIVARAMRESPENRYQSADAMRQDLVGILTQPVAQSVVVPAGVDDSPPAHTVTPTGAVKAAKSGEERSSRDSAKTQAFSPTTRRPNTAMLVLGTTGLLVLAALVFFFANRETGDDIKTETEKGEGKDLLHWQNFDQELAGATKERPFVNSLGMKFVPVPIEGGPTSGKKVLFSLWQARVQDYEVFVKETKRAWAKADFEQARTHPAVQVSWEDANSFCAWITERERTAGRLGSNGHYRLPSDHEWTCAVGLGDREDAAESPVAKSSKLNGVFPWGTQWPPPNGAGNFAGAELQDALAIGKYRDVHGVISDYEDGFETTSPVGSFLENPFGLYDMGGNVWEWCEDWSDTDQKHRVLRGGSWINHLEVLLLSSNRGYIDPLRRFHDLGFRLVLEVSDTPPDFPLAEGRRDPAKATNDEPFVNSLGMKFVPVPGTGVLFCIHEARRQDYAAFAAETSGVGSAWKSQILDGVPCGDKDDHPVVAVNWDDAREFCAWISRKEGRNYRLPTDEEWSIAVGLGGVEKHGGDITPEMLTQVAAGFPWGGNYPPKTLDQAGNYADLAWHEKFPSQPYLENYSDGFATTSPVMSYKANKFGLHDLGGNVWEWCEDQFNTTKHDRVLRGASFRSRDRGALLSSIRAHRPPGYGDRTIGFRCVVASAADNASTDIDLANAGRVSGPNSLPLPPTIPVGDPAKATKEEPFVNSLSMKFVPVPGTGVLFCIHETRYRDWAAHAAETPDLRASWTKQAVDGFALTERPEDHPVAAISWEEVVAFCVWLSQKEGKTYRLPTNQEWEIAVEGGRGEESMRSPSDGAASEIEPVFPWEGQWPPPTGVANYADTSLNDQFPKRAFIEGYTDGFPTTAPVMSFQPNSLGIYDLAGNIQEWMGDWPDAGQENNRIHRGGSWATSDRARLSASHRDRNQAFSRTNERGFRIVLERINETAK